MNQSQRKAALAGGRIVTKQADRYRAVRRQKGEALLRLFVRQHRRIYDTRGETIARASVER